MILGVFSFMESVASCIRTDKLLRIWKGAVVVYIEINNGVLRAQLKNKSFG
jgi:hypothetical protein